jgi:hypothetical protein
VIERPEAQSANELEILLRSEFESNRRKRIAFLEERIRRARHIMEEEPLRIGRSAWVGLLSGSCVAVGAVWYFSRGSRYGSYWVMVSAIVFFFFLGSLAAASSDQCDMYRENRDNLEQYERELDEVKNARYRD